MKQMEADVVVVACGMSGLAATTQAQESLNATGGGKVIAFEKSGTTGGAANMGMALLAFESQLQKENMTNDFTKDDAFRFFMEYTHWRSDAKLVRRWFNQSSETIEWLQDMGVEFLGVFKYFKNSHVTQHMVKAPGSNKPAERSASIMNKIITDHALEIGAEIKFNTPVKEILVGSQGQVRGVRAVSDDGEEIECLCNCVIVATGGMGNNVKMIEEHMGWKWGVDMFTFRIPGIDGDGMNMVWNIGGRKAKVNMEVTYNTPGTTDIFKTLSETMRQPNLMVNLDGKRFINEEIMDNTTFTGNSLLLQKHHCGFSIIDSTIVDYYKRHGLDYITYHHGITNMDKWDKELDLYTNHKGIEETGLAALHHNLEDVEEAQTNFWVCQSLEEVAEKTGINLENLKATIEEYNQMCNGGQRGYDWQFTKDHRFLKPITTAPYYVARHFPSGYGSLGGIEVNENMQVLNNDLDPIPGLYACGNDTATVFSDSYCFYNPGSTMSYAINSGRIAGKECVAYMDSDAFIDPED
jgi:fumarate reductase flavoprotein subunit